jgi:Rap1a immunity proteins
MAENEEPDVSTLYAMRDSRPVRPVNKAFGFPRMVLYGIATAIALYSPFFYNDCAAQEVEKPQSVTAQSFEKLCASDDPRDKGACDLSIIAILTMAGAYKMKVGPHPDDPVFPAFCFRAPVDNESLRRVYLASLVLHPERKQTPFPAAVLLALRDAFPCP